jgi:ferredoxin-NADP reductase
VHVAHTLTREQPAGWPGYRRRIDRQMLAEVPGGTDRDAQAFVCGPTALVESVAADLVALGLPPAQVKTERFGPSGA